MDAPSLACPITLTAPARAAFVRLRRGPEDCLRLLLGGGGAHGAGLALTASRAPASGDAVFDCDGVRVLIARDGVEQVRGLWIDFDEAGEGAFVFRTPSAPEAP